VQCSGERACKGATITCPELYACDVHCEGHEACKDADVFGASGPGTVSCASGTKVCKGAAIHCGTDACNVGCPSQHPPSVVCAGSCLCTPC
jgi:hypothetical protein